VTRKLKLAVKKQIHPYAEYWKIYGGRSALFSSLYFYASIAFTIVCYPNWSSPDWWESSISLLPSIIGFMIGSFALLLAFGGDYFKSLMARAPGKKIHSSLDEVSANFTHFLVVQFSALFFALFLQAAHKIPFPEFLLPLIDFIRIPFWGIGYFLLIYSLACALASVMSIFRIARAITIVENVLLLQDRAKKAESDKEKKP
jgi:hypothetical protein